MSDLFVEKWGTGTPVVLVHGSLATGTDEWQAQRPLADQGFQLVVFDRRGYGRSPAAAGEDSFGFDAICDDLAERIGASRLVVAGAGHEIQFTGAPINEALLALWHGASPPATS